MVLITTAVEFCPALHTEISIFIMSEFLGASRGMQLERGEEGEKGKRKKRGEEKERERGRDTCRRVRGIKKGYYVTLHIHVAS